MELLESSGNTRTAGSRRTKAREIGQCYNENGRNARSGQCYAPINLGTRERESFTKNGGIKIAAPKGKDKEPINEPVTEEEANEFLKFIKHSEYSIVKQLHKLPAKISLLALMMNSEPHREVVLKVLKQAYVPHNASIEKIDRLMGT